jgi:hypothetical protein
MKPSILKKALSYAFIGGILVFASCKKDKLPVIDPQPVGTAGVYVLSEGAFSSAGAPSSLTYYNVATKALDKDYFRTQNGRALGLNANDLEQYGSKMYCVITGTTKANKDSYVEVISIATGKSLKRIPFSDASGGFVPRYVTFYKGKAYVSGYDGYLTRVDTASMNIESRIKVGGAMEQMAVVNGKLYVTNSNQPNFPDANNSSVSVVDLSTFSKLPDIPVSFNPTKIAATSAGDLFVVSKGNYANLLPAFDKLSSITDKSTGSISVSLENAYVFGNRGFVITGYPAYLLKNFNISTGVVGASFVTDATVLSVPYDVKVNPLSGDVYVTDSPFIGDGKTVCFSAEGKYQFDFATGPVPRSPVFNYTYK